MDSKRQQRFARLIQKEIGDIFQKDGRNYFGSSFLTITGARVTPDLSIARIYISTFHEKGEDVLLKLNAHKSEIRHQLGNKIKNQARVIPDLEFFIDDSLDYAEKMDKIFNDLNIPPDQEPQSDQ